MINSNNIWFAWFPVKTVNWGWVWLRTVRREWNEYLNPWADASGYSGYDGGWEYYE